MNGVTQVNSIENNVQPRDTYLHWTLFVKNNYSSSNWINNSVVVRRLSHSAMKINYHPIGNIYQKLWKINACAFLIAKRKTIFQTDFPSQLQWFSRPEAFNHNGIREVFNVSRIWIHFVRSASNSQYNKSSNPYR